MTRSELSLSIYYEIVLAIDGFKADRLLTAVQFLFVASYDRRSSTSSLFGIRYTFNISTRTGFNIRIFIWVSFI